MYNCSLNILIMSLFFLDANAELTTESYNFGKETIFTCSGIPECKEANVDIESVANFFDLANEKREYLKVAYNICFRLACEGNVDAMYALANACFIKKEFSFIFSNIMINGRAMTEDQFWNISNYLEQHLENDDEINYKKLFQEAVREAAALSKNIRLNNNIDSNDNKKMANAEVTNKNSPNRTFDIVDPFYNK